MAIEYGDPTVIWEDTLGVTTARMMQEISLKIDEHIIETILRPAFEAGRSRGVADQTDAYWGPPYSDDPDFEEWLPAFLSHFQGDVD